MEATAYYAGQRGRASVVCLVAAAPPFPQPRALDALTLFRGDRDVFACILTVVLSLGVTLETLSGKPIVSRPPSQSPFAIESCRPAGILADLCCCGGGCYLFS